MPSTASVWLANWSQATWKPPLVSMAKAGLPAVTPSGVKVVSSAPMVAGGIPQGAWSLPSGPNAGVRGGQTPGRDGDLRPRPSVVSPSTGRTGRSRGTPATHVTQAWPDGLTSNDGLRCTGSRSTRCPRPTSPRQARGSGDRPVPRWLTRRPRRRGRPIAVDRDRRCVAARAEPDDRRSRCLPGVMRDGLALVPPIAVPTGAEDQRRDEKTGAPSPTRSGTAVRHARVAPGVVARGLCRLEVDPTGRRMRSQVSHLLRRRYSFVRRDSCALPASEASADERNRSSLASATRMSAGTDCGAMPNRSAIASSRPRRCRRSATA